jgi:hypothetical protein
MGRLVSNREKTQLTKEGWRLSKKRRNEGGGETGGKRVKEGSPQPPEAPQPAPPAPPPPSHAEEERGAEDVKLAQDRIRVVLTALFSSGDVVAIDDQDVVMAIAAAARVPYDKVGVDLVSSMQDVPHSITCNCRPFTWC